MSDIIVIPRCIALMLGLHAAMRFFWARYNCLEAYILYAAEATAMPAGVTGCPTDMDCSNYFCISSAMSKNWKKAGK